MQLSAPRIVAVLILCVAAAGCSRALRFNFAFSQGDGGVHSGNDLAMTLDQARPDDLSKPADQQIPDQASPDLRVVGHDLLSQSDLAMPDLAVPDLRTNSLGDLLMGDMIVPSRLGTACNPADLNPCGLLFGLECVTSYATISGSGDTVIVGGYCTKKCSGPSDCTPYGGTCEPLEKTGNVCMPLCQTACARQGYSCCNYCTSSGGPTMCTVEKVCAPPGVVGYCN